MKLLDLMPKSGSTDIVQKLEQIGAAVLGAALFALVSRFLPFWVDGLLLAGIVVAGFYLAEEYLVGVVSFAILAGFYLLLVQPTMMLAFSMLAGLAAAVAAVYYLIEARLWQILLAALAAMLGTTALVMAIFMALYAYVLPGLHPLTVWFFNISPAVSVVSTLAIIAYASFRQPAEEDSYYWLTVPALSLLFVLFFWPSHSYLAAAVVGCVALGLSLLAYLNRPTWEKRGRSHLTLVAATVCGVVFAAWFTVANRWEWFYNYQMANAITVNRHELSDIPVTKPTRLVPLIAAVDFCSQGNHPSYTDFGAEPHPKLIVINKDGQEKQFWQCLRYPTRLQGHLVSWLTGGIEGFILSDAGTRGRFSDEIDENFLFGDHSLFTRAVFNARHPGSTMEDGVVGRSVDGKYALLIPYVSRSLQWGGMIPDFSGVMVLSPWGFVEDLTPAQAAARYPGVPLYPAQLARQYAELWAQESSVYAKVWSGDMLKVSELSEETDNRYPFWQNFEGGVMGVVPFEPVGRLR